MYTIACIIYISRNIHTYMHNGCVHAHIHTKAHANNRRTDAVSKLHRRSLSRNSRYGPNRKNCVAAKKQRRRSPTQATSRSLSHIYAHIHTYLSRDPPLRRPCNGSTTRRSSDWDHGASSTSLCPLTQCSFPARYVHRGINLEMVHTAHQWRRN